MGGGADRDGAREKDGEPKSDEEAGGGGREPSRSTEPEATEHVRAHWEAGLAAKHTDVTHRKGAWLYGWRHKTAAKQI